MLKHIVLVAFVTCGAAAAYAQPQQAASPPASTASPAIPAMQPVASADTRKLIGRNIQNAQNETIGEIKSIYVGKDGKVDSVIVSVGGFLGIGDREVRIAWSDLHIAGNGEKVTVNMTKDQLKASPEYKYANETYRGRLFTDAGPWSAGPRSSDATKPLSDNLAEATKPADRMAQTTKPADSRTKPVDTTDKPATNTAAVTSTGDFNTAGEMSANSLIGASVRTEGKETIGKVEDLYVDNTGAIKTIVVSVGGFLGVGSKDVAVQWSDVKFARDGKSVVISTSWTKDSLRNMPDYKYERRQPAATPAATPRSGG